MKPKKRQSATRTMLYTPLDRHGRNRRALGGYVGAELNKHSERQSFFVDQEQKTIERMKQWLETQPAKDFIANIRKEQWKLDRKNRLISEAVYKKQLEKDDEIPDAYTEATQLKL